MNSKAYVLGHLDDEGYLVGVGIYSEDHQRITTSGRLLPVLIATGAGNTFSEAIDSAKQIYNALTPKLAAKFPAR